MLKKYHSLVATTIFIVLSMGIFTSSQASELKEGQSAPDFELLDQSETKYSLQQYRGKWVVLYFYPKDDTPGCTKEACAFRDDIAILQSLDAQVLGVSVDDSASHAKFAEKYSLQFPLLADEGGAVAKKYACLTKIGPLKLAKRHTFIIDPAGKLAKIYRRVSPSSHSNEVITELKALKEQLSKNN